MMLHRTQVRPIVIALVVLSGAMVGCAADSSTALVPASVSVPVDVPTDRWLDPLESMRDLGDDDAAVLWAAEQRAIADCMREKGFTYLPEDFVPTRWPVVRHEGDVAFAEKWGYAETLDGHDPVLIKSPERVLKNDSSKMSAAEKDAWDLALSGRPIEDENASWVRRIDFPGGYTLISVEGCTADADSLVYGDYETWRRLDSSRQDLSNAVIGAVDADPVWTEANQRWSACMAPQGYSYPDHAAAYAELARRAREQKPSQEQYYEWQRPVAVADARCTQEVGLIRVHNSLVRKHEALVIEDNQAVVKQFLDMRAQAIEKACQI